MPMQASRITAQTRTPATEHLLLYLPAGLHAALPVGLRAALLVLLAALLVLLAASRLLHCVLRVLQAKKGAAHESFPAITQAQRTKRSSSSSSNNVNKITSTKITLRATLHQGKMRTKTEGGNMRTPKAEEMPANSQRARQHGVPEAASKAAAASMRRPPPLTVPPRSTGNRAFIELNRALIAP